MAPVQEGSLSATIGPPLAGGSRLTRQSLKTQRAWFAPGWGAGLVLLFVGSATIQAQTEEEIRRPDREVAIQQEVQKVSDEAARRAALESKETVTYEQVLADPDNLELNYRYAQAQIKRGDLLGASVTLERLLMLRPEQAEYRYLYGMVLFQLDSLQEAEQELETVRNLPVPDEIRRQIDATIKRIHHSRQRTQWLASLTTGWSMDSNHNSSPSAEGVLFADTFLPLDDPVTQQHRDTALLVVGSLDVTHDPGFQLGHQLFANLTYYRSEQSYVDSLDLQSYSLKGGVMINTGWLKFRPSLVGSHVMLSGEKYVRTGGAELRADWEARKWLALYTEGGWAHEAYENITENQVATQRSGDKQFVTGGASVVLSPTMKLETAFTFTNKEAKEQFNAYEGHGLSTTHTWLLGKGQFLLNTLEFETDGYREVDAAISVRRRRDKQLRYRFTYGAPVAFLLGERVLPAPWLANLTAVASFEQFRSLSNVLNYTYSNSKITLMLTKSVEF